MSRIQSLVKLNEEHKRSKSKTLRLRKDMFTGVTSKEITAFYPSSLDVFLCRFSPWLLTPTDLSHLLSVASQIAAVFRSCLFFCF